MARARAVFDAETLGGAEVVDDIVHAYAPGCRRSLSRGDPQQGDHERHHRRGPGDRQRHPGGGGERALARHQRRWPVHVDVPFERDAGGNLVASLELPMPVGLVGGATKVHPAAQAAVKLLEISTAQQLAEVIVAAGLAQNVAACRALATEGIQRGHMSLHARNIAVAADATADELPLVVARLVRDRAVRQDHAERILAELRSPAPTAPTAAQEPDTQTDDYGFSA